MRWGEGAFAWVEQTPACQPTLDPLMVFHPGIFNLLLAPIQTGRHR